ncbi:MAG: transcription termination/antitermination protein NusG [Armatimonadota bacterium]|nr:transcription termination/antitermination protein NusG [Armatimonadota bacterium]
MLSNWYAVHTISGHENKVASILRRRAVVEGYWDRELLDILIPTEQAVQNRDGKKRVVERKVLPGYLLVRMILTEDSMRLVKTTSGVTGFVSSGSKPVPISDSEVQGIKKRLEESREKPKVAWTAGDTIRVAEGPFMDFTGRIEEVFADREKVKVLITIFGRDTPVELDFTHVEKA